MSYNHTQNYFDFRGKRYGVGTIVKIKPEPHGSRRQIERCNGVAKFVGGFESGYLRFSGVVPSGEQYCGIAIMNNPEDRIEQIIQPVFYEYKPAWQIAMTNYQNTHPARRADITPGTILYLAAMGVGAIFKGAIVIWVIATIVYLRYLVDMYRD